MSGSIPLPAKRKRKRGRQDINLPALFLISYPSPHIPTAEDHGVQRIRTSRASKFGRREALAPSVFLPTLIPLLLKHSRSRTCHNASDAARVAWTTNGEEKSRTPHEASWSEFLLWELGKGFSL